jgi:hypothetical protein
MLSYIPLNFEVCTGDQSLILSSNRLLKGGHIKDWALHIQVRKQPCYSADGRCATHAFEWQTNATVRLANFPILPSTRAALCRRLQS